MALAVSECVVNVSLAISFADVQPEPLYALYVYVVFSVRLVSVAAALVWFAHVPVFGAVSFSDQFVVWVADASVSVAAVSLTPLAVSVADVANVSLASSLAAEQPDPEYDL